MLIAKKPYSGRAKKVQLKNYKCEPTKHEQLNNGMKTYEEHKARINQKKEKGNEISGKTTNEKGENQKQNKLTRRIKSLIFR